MNPFPAKFCRVTDAGEHVPHDYGDRYFRQPCGDSQRLVIGPSTDQTDCLAELAAEFECSAYYVLYVLLLSHSNRQPGRYASPPFESIYDLRVFLSKFGDFFETDGRHHVWIAAADSPDLLVYDQHNVIFAYGGIDRFEGILNDRGFVVEEFWFPVPHSHSYPPEHASDEDELMAYCPWQHSPLQPGDEWD